MNAGEEEAQTLIENVFRNVPVEPRDAREVYAFPPLKLYWTLIL